MNARTCTLAVIVALGVAAPSANAAATIVLNNLNGPGVGFNDPTPVAPVGGNTGTTLGQQRLNAFAYALNLWGATLTSTATIVVNATFEPLTCTATGAVLGSAGATSVFRDFPGAPRSGTWYSAALANKLVGVDLDPLTNDIRARFNSNLGAVGCLTGLPFYLGLDGNEGAAVDFVAVAQHELAHGLGFQTFTSGSTGAQIAGFPSIWDHFLTDTVNNVNWVTATAAQRVASAISVDKLVWNGANVVSAVPTVLSPTPQALITGRLTTNFAVGTAAFGPPLTTTGITQQIMPVVDQADGRTGLACNPLSPANALAVNGKIALVDRGVCGFTVKVKNAQNAGAVGVIIGDNVTAPVSGLGGADPTIVIPSVRITLSDANTLKDALRFRSRTASGVFGTLKLDTARLAGADSNGRALMYAPAAFSAGSSVSHFDVSASPNQLMEPSINSNLTQQVQPPADLTLPLFRDIGW